MYIYIYLFIYFYLCISLCTNTCLQGEQQLHTPQPSRKLFFYSQIFLITHGLWRMRDLRYRWDMGQVCQIVHTDAYIYIYILYIYIYIEREI